MRKSRYTFTFFIKALWMNEVDGSWHQSDRPKWQYFKIDSITDNSNQRITAKQMSSRNIKAQIAISLSS